ncbi:hypothetical protein EGT07_13480 [Herbaspirillum sp. HC18]|nr:hypothetical protein EGT07_13480 [Herbaspirillum sp. HC18]
MAIFGKVTGALQAAKDAVVSKLDNVTTCDGLLGSKTASTPHKPGVVGGGARVRQDNVRFEGLPPEKVSPQQPQAKERALKLFSAVPKKYDSQLSNTRLYESEFELHFPGISAAEKTILGDALSKVYAMLPYNDQIPHTKGKVCMQMLVLMQSLSSACNGSATDAARALACMQNIDHLASISHPNAATVRAARVHRNPARTNACPRIGTANRFEQHDLSNSWKLAIKLAETSVGFRLFQQLSAMPDRPTPDTVHASVREEQDNLLRVYLRCAEQKVTEARSEATAGGRPLSPDPLSVFGHIAQVRGVQAAAVPPHTGVVLADDATLAEKAIYAAKNYGEQLELHITGPSGGADPFERDRDQSNWAFNAAKNGFVTETGPFADCDHRIGKVETYARRAARGPHRDSWQKFKDNVRKRLQPGAGMSPFFAFTKNRADFGVAAGYGGAKDGRTMSELLEELNKGIRAYGRVENGVPGPLFSAIRPGVAGAPGEPAIENNPPDQGTLIHAVRLALATEKLKIPMARLKDGTALSGDALERAKVELYKWFAGGRDAQTPATQDLINTIMEDENRGFTPQRLVQWAQSVGGPADSADAMDKADAAVNRADRLAANVVTRANVAGQTAANTALYAAQGAAVEAFMAAPPLNDIPEDMAAIAALWAVGQPGVTANDVVTAAVRAPINRLSNHLSSMGFPVPHTPHNVADEINLAALQATHMGVAAAQAAAQPGANAASVAAAVRACEVPPQVFNTPRHHDSLFMAAPVLAAVEAAARRAGATAESVAQAAQLAYSLVRNANLAATNAQWQPGATPQSVVSSAVWAVQNTLLPDPSGSIAVARERANAGSSPADVAAVVAGGARTPAIAALARVSAAAAAAAAVPGATAGNIAEAAVVAASPLISPVESASAPDHPDWYKFSLGMARVAHGIVRTPNSEITRQMDVADIGRVVHHMVAQAESSTKMSVRQIAGTNYKTGPITHAFTHVLSGGTVAGSGNVELNYSKSLGIELLSTAAGHEVGLWRGGPDGARRGKNPVKRALNMLKPGKIGVGVGGSIGPDALAHKFDDSHETRIGASAGAGASASRESVVQEGPVIRYERVSPKADASQNGRLARTVRKVISPDNHPTREEGGQWTDPPDVRDHRSPLKRLLHEFDQASVGYQTVKEVTWKGALTGSAGFGAVVGNFREGSHASGGMEGKSTETHTNEEGGTYAVKRQSTAWTRKVKVSVVLQSLGLSFADGVLSQGDVSATSRAGIADLLGVSGDVITAGGGTRQNYIYHNGELSTNSYRSITYIDTQSFVAHLSGRLDEMAQIKAEKDSNYNKKIRVDEPDDEMRRRQLRIVQAKREELSAYLLRTLENRGRNQQHIELQGLRPEVVETIRGLEAVIKGLEGASHSRTKGTRGKITDCKKRIEKLLKNDNSWTFKVLVDAAVESASKDPNFVLPIQTFRSLQWTTAANGDSI